MYKSEELVVMLAIS